MWYTPRIHIGLRRYKHLNFGISSAAEIFRETVSEKHQGLQGVKNMSDDIIVYGETQEQHDTRLKKNHGKATGAQHNTKPTKM